jgi:hypothetical protein
MDAHAAFSSSRASDVACKSPNALADIPRSSKDRNGVSDSTTERLSDPLDHARTRQLTGRQVDLPTRPEGGLGCKVIRLRRPSTQPRANSGPGYQW